MLREGWQAINDDYPAEFNFTQPLLFDTLNPELLVPGPTEEPVSVKGAILDRGEFEAMRREYYELRQWDPDTGLPTRGPLESLNLSEAARGITSGRID